MNINEAGTPRTIDAAGNIVPKPYGAGRWHSPRKYECKHEDCNNLATMLGTACFSIGGIGRAHNCCGDHESEGTE